MIISMIPPSFKQKVKDIVMKQEMKFMYLGIELSSYGNFESEVRGKITKAIGIEAKFRIYKTSLRFIKIYRYSRNKTRNSKS